MIRVFIYVYMLYVIYIYMIRVFIYVYDQSIYIDSGLDSSPSPRYLHLQGHFVVIRSPSILYKLYLI